MKPENIPGVEIITHSQEYTVTTPEVVPWYWKGKGAPVAVLSILYLFGLFFFVLFMKTKFDNQLHYFVLFIGLLDFAEVLYRAGKKMPKTERHNEFYKVRFTDKLSVNDYLSLQLEFDIKPDPSSDTYILTRKEHNQ